MDIATAKEIIKDTEYLDGRILILEEEDKPKFCKIIWKGYSATATDEDNQEGSARVRVKDLLSGKEFTDNLTKVAQNFPPEFISSKENSKKEILNFLQENSAVEAKTVDLITESISIGQDKVAVERLLTELWLESKVTKARFKTDDLVVYNSRK